MLVIDGVWMGSMPDRSWMEDIPNDDGASAASGSVRPGDLPFKDVTGGLAKRPM